MEILVIITDHDKDDISDYGSPRREYLIRYAAHILKVHEGACFMHFSS